MDSALFSSCPAALACDILKLTFCFCLLYVDLETDLQSSLASVLPPYLPLYTHAQDRAPMWFCLQRAQIVFLPII